MRPVRRANKPCRLHVPIVLKSGSLKLLEPSGPVQVFTGIAWRLSNSMEQSYSWETSMLACAMAHANVAMYIKYHLLIFAEHYTNQNCVRVVPPEDGQVMPEACRGFEV
jgi:hypothetical protein